MSKSNSSQSSMGAYGMEGIKKSGVKPAQRKELMDQLRAAAGQSK